MFLSWAAGNMLVMVALGFVSGLIYFKMTLKWSVGQPGDRHPNKKTAMGTLFAFALINMGTEERFDATVCIFLVRRVHDGENECTNSLS